MQLSEKFIAEYFRKEQEMAKIAAVCGERYLQQGVKKAIEALGITTGYSSDLYAEALYKLVVLKGELVQDVIMKFFCCEFTVHRLRG